MASPVKLFFRMKFLTLRLLALGTPLMLTSCATVGPPQPPSLELPKTPSDLRAVRKGDHVILTWTIPVATTDRQTVRSFGPTRICRGLEAELAQCGTPVGETLAHPVAVAAKSSKQKPTTSYTDALPAQLGADNSYALATYAVEVLNADGRGAGLSNQVRVPLARTLPPPRDFAARVTGQGIVLTSTTFPRKVPRRLSTTCFAFTATPKAASSGFLPARSLPEVNATSLLPIPASSGKRHTNTARRRLA